MHQNRFVAVLARAKQKGIAVGAVNIFNELSADAAVTAAKELGTDLILQTSAGTVEHFGARRLYSMLDAVRQDAGITVAIHLDHCRNTGLGKLCVDTGWDSVMMDFSQLPFEENIEKTMEVAVYAHSRGVAVEGEIGIISGVEEEITSNQGVGAGYEETMEFVKRTGIDAVAPAIGTAHGVYHGEPKLDYDLVEKLGKERTPLVVHGGTGLSAQAFTRLIALGARKINISTLVKNTYLNTIRQLVASGEKYSPIAFDTEVKAAVTAQIRKHLEVFSGLRTEF